MTLEELLVAVGINTDDLTAGADGAANQVEQSLGGIQTAAAGVAVGGMFMAGLQSAMDMQATQAQLEAGFGLTEQEAARAGDAAGRLYSAGWGQSMEEVGTAIGTVAQAMGGLGELSNAELDELSKHAMTLSKTLGTDVGDAAHAAGQMIKLGLAKDGEDAFNVLTRAAQTLPASMRADIPAVIGEYGKHFQRLGIDGQTAFGLLSQYVQAGGRDIDQAADVIHEFARITSEETDRAAGAFKKLNLPAKQMLEDIGEGGPAAEAALSKTLSALRGVKDPAQQAALGVELFGDMAGEGADALWAMDPATAAAATGMDKTAGAADKATAAVSASQSLSSIWRTMATTLGEMLLPVLKPVSEFMSENPALVKVLAGALIALGVGIGLAVIAQWAWNTALWAFPGTWIIAGILALVAIVILVIAYWDEIKAATLAVWDWVWGKIKAVTGWIVDLFLNWTIVGRIIKHWDQIQAKTIAVWDAIVDWVSGIPGRTSAALSSLGSRIWSVARAAWTRFKTANIALGMQAVAWVRGLPGRISSALGNLGSLLYGKGMDVVRGLWRGIQAMGGWLRSTLMGWARNLIPGPIAKALGIASPSKLLADQVGQWIPSGIAVGITTNLAPIRQAADLAAQAAVPDLPTGAVRGLSRMGGREEQHLVVDVTGGDEDLARLVRKWVTAKGGPDRFFATT